MCVNMEIVLKGGRGTIGKPKDILFEYHRAVVPFFEQLGQLDVSLPYSKRIQIKHL